MKIILVKFLKNSEPMALASPYSGLKPPIPKNLAIYIVCFMVLLVGCNNTKSKNSSKEEPYFSQQWYLTKNQKFYEKNNIDNNASIHFDPQTPYTGKGITIAVIDDGLDTSHEEFTQDSIISYDITTKTSDVKEPSFFAHHGTAVTGIIKANINHKGIRGIAPHSKLIFLKLTENMSDAQTIELFNKAVELKADIINCSWGTYDVSPAVKEVIQEIAINGRNKKGVIIVFSVGNDNQDMGNDESAIPEVIAVGSTNEQNLRATYSNYGKELDILAVGGETLTITTLDVSGEKGISTLDEEYILANNEKKFFSTSASAPMVTGVVALLLEKNPHLTREEVINLLKKTLYF